MSDACAAHLVCVAVCAAKALTATTTMPSIQVGFARELCTGCGRCVETCPERALTVRPAPKGEAAAFRIIKVHTPRHCSACDEPFVTKGEDELCALCRKDRALFAPRGIVVGLLSKVTLRQRPARAQE